MNRTKKHCCGYWLSGFSFNQSQRECYCVDKHKNVLMYTKYVSRMHYSKNFKQTHTVILSSFPIDQSIIYFKVDTSIYLLMNSLYLRVWIYIMYLYINIICSGNFSQKCFFHYNWRFISVMIFQSLQEFEAEANKQRTQSEQTIASLQQQVKHFYHSLITLCFWKHCFTTATISVKLNIHNSYQ